MAEGPVCHNKRTRTRSCTFPDSEWWVRLAKWNTCMRKWWLRVFPPAGLITSVFFCVGVSFFNLCVHTNWLCEAPAS